MTIPDPSVFHQPLYIKFSIQNYFNQNHLPKPCIHHQTYISPTKPITHTQNNHRTLLSHILPIRHQHTRLFINTRAPRKRRALINREITQPVFIANYLHFHNAQYIIRIANYGYTGRAVNIGGPGTLSSGLKLVKAGRFH